MPTLTEDQRQLLETYLADHWAGAGAGSDMAGRLASNNAETTWGPRLEALATAIAEDEAALGDIRAALDIDSGNIKRGLAKAGEKVARLTPNNRVTTYSPLSRIVEAEAMMTGVAGKHRLWDAVLHSSIKDLDELQRFDFEELRRRADEQLSMLEDFHQWAAAEAFGGAAP